MDKSTGDVAADSYHNLQRDLQLLQDLGVHAYRFSISWSRILPDGEPRHVNDKGVAYYNQLIDGLRQRNITPFVTMFHWDTPETLQRQFGGFANPLIQTYFRDYARVLFEKFGDRVSHWITFNEPTEFCGNGYGDNTEAPAMDYKGFGCYLCMHHVILSHAQVYRMYQRDFKKQQQGEIGITLNDRWAFPLVSEYQPLVDRHMIFTLAWQMDPLFLRPFQGYPEEMRRQVDVNSRTEKHTHSRLPEFTDEERELFKDPVVDFLGLNYYTSRMVSPGMYSPDAEGSVWKDLNLTFTTRPEWIRAKSPWLYAVPEGLFHLLVWIKDRYQSPKIYITENGWSDEGKTRDIDREKYLRDHLVSVQMAILQGVDVQGYFHWSLMDNFEWTSGYT